MGAYAHGFALVQHYNLLCVAYGADALSDYYHGRVLCFGGKRVAESGVGLEVKCREAVVKDIKLRLFYERAGNRELNGVDIRRMPQYQLRDNIAYVQQR